MVMRTTTTSLGAFTRSCVGHFVPLVLLLGFQQVEWAHAHGSTLSPRGRAIGMMNHCPWCDGGHYPVTNPYGAAHLDAVPSSPCMGSVRDMAVYPSTMYNTHSNLAANPFTQYAAGQTFEAKVLLNADHAGQAAWMLCPYSEAETEECFRDRIVHDWEDVHTFWGGDSSIDHWKDDQYFPQSITLPADLEPGNYTLRWIWICKFTDEIFVTCIDMYIGAAGTEVVNSDPLGTSTPDSGAGSVGGGGGCVAQWNSCLTSHTCCDAGDTCFEKDGYYAQCRPTCTGTGDTAGFSCNVLGGVAPTTAPTPTMGPTYPTMAPTYPTMAPTYPTMAPTYPTMAPTYPTMAPTSPTMAPTASTSCTNPTQNFGNCSATKCCNSGWTCFEKDAYYAECRQPCPPNGETGWTCNVLSSLLETSSAPALVQAATNGTTTCAAKGQSCASTPCCDGTCYEKDEFTAECKDECTDADKKAGWSCFKLAHPGARSGESCSKLHDQCGGNHWSGTRSCCEGTCTVVDSNYHQCRPTSFRQIKRHGSFLASRASALMQQEKEMTHGLCSASEADEAEDEFKEEL